MDKTCCWMVDLSAPMARPPSVTRGAILRGRASVVSLGIERASGRLRAVGPSCVCVNASCAREPLSLACSPVRWRLGPGRWRPGSLHVHVNPMGGGLGALPTMPPIGFSCALTGYCACSGVRARAACEARRRCAHIADHLAHNTRLSAFFAEVVCTLGATPTKATRGPPPNGDLRCERCTVELGLRRGRHQTGGIAPIEARHAGDTPTQCF